MKREGTPSLLSVPVHGAKAVGVGLLKSQIEVAGLTVEQFLNLL
jgi:hypothetical protein